MATNEELRPSKRPALAGFAWLLALVALVGGGSALLAPGALRDEAPKVEFLEQALGAPTRTAPLQRSLPTGERFRIRDRALVAESDFGSVALEPIGLARGSRWTRAQNGVTRRTPFGSRTLVLDGTKAEEFLTVERRQGVRTWRWQLDTKLDPTSSVDGRVALVDRRTGGTFAIEPVQILDAAGDAVTPRGLRWTLRGHQLELTLDDREFPLPYVIDPAITVVAPNGVHATSTTNALSLAKPTGTLVSGSTVLVAHVSKRNADAVTASGWISIGQTCNGTTICTALLWKRFAGEAGPYSFGWTNATGAAGGVVALANVWQPGSRSPVDSTVGASGTGTTANPGSLTNLFTTLGEMAVGGFAGQDVTPGIPTGKTDAGSAAIASGAQGTRIGARTATFNETAGTISNWSSTLTSAAWSAQLAGLIPDATDGSGTLATATTNVAASSTGNTIAFAYTPNAGLDDGSVSVQVPAGWTAPQTAAGNGQITVSGGTGTNTITISGTGPWTVRVDNVQIGDDGAGGIETLTITYNSGTAPAATGAQTWQAQSRGVAAGTMTNLAASPSITVRAPNGSGTIGSALSNAANGATAQTATFTYTAAAGGMASGAITIDVPIGWTPPNTTAGTAGYTTASTGTVTTSGQKITVAGVTLAAAATMTITYGSGAGGGATATTTPGPATWQAQQRSVTGGTLTNLASSPSVNVYDANAAGTISQTAGSTNATRGAAIGSALTWTFTAGAGGMSSGSLGISVPAGWTAPRTTAGAGFTAVSAGTLAVSGQQIQVTGLTLAAGATMTVTYGSGGGANLPTTGTTSGANTFSVVKHSTAGIGSAVATTSQPAAVNVYSADGSGTIGVSPTSAVAGSTANALTFTYTAATGGIGAGVIELAIPTGWTAPQTSSSTSAGYTTASGGSGTNAIAWNGGTRKLTISDVTLAAAGTLTITYGANAGSGGGAAAPTSTGAATAWTTQQKSISGGSLATVGTSPSVTVNPGALSDFLVDASGGGAIGTQTAGAAFTVRVTARDAYGNTVTSFTGAGNTVEITSTGTLASGGGTTGSFTSGVLASHSVSITSSGSRTITATRTSGGAQSGSSTAFTVNPAPAATLDVVAPGTATAGTPFSVGVTARDVFNNVATGYLGTAAFSGGGTGAQLPATYTFVAGDAGIKTFGTVELRQAGSRTLTVTDTVTSSITGNDGVTVDPGAASPTTSTLIPSPTSIAANGSSTSTVTLRLKDAFGNDLTSGDGATYVFTTDRGSVGSATNNGDGTYSATLTSSTSAGTANVSATRNAAAFSSSTSVTFAPGPALVLDVAAPVTATAGSPFSVTVTAKDVNGNTATGYLGTVAFSGGGTGAQLPASYTFVAGDAGVKTFATVGLRQTGSRTVTVTDTVTGSITGNDTVTVGHAATAVLTVVPPANGVTGQAFSTTVTANDAYANVATGYLGTVTFSSGGGGGTVPAAYTFVGGDNGSTSVAGFSFSTSGSKSVSATDMVTGSISGSGSITIDPAGASLTNSTFGASPTSIAANGSSTSAITLQLKDALGNDLTVSDGAGYAFTTSRGSIGSATDNGNGTISATLTSSTSAGVATVSATRDGSPFAGSVAVTFAPGPATTLEVSAPANATAGSPFSVDVTARDAQGNVATGYTGTIAFSGGGSGSQLPANYTFVSGDAGTRTFTAELRQAGSRAVTATDTVTGTISGNDAVAVGHGAASQIALSGSTANLTSADTRVLTATIEDGWGNSVTADSSTIVAFAKQSGAGTVTGAGSATAANGVATKTITGALAGSVTMEASAAGLTTGTLAAFTVVHGAAAQIALGGSTADLTSGAARGLTATIQDAAGNTVSADNTTVVSFGQASGTGTVSGTGTATASSGVATKTVSGALAGSVTLEAIATGLTTGALGAFTVVPGTAAQIQLTGSTADLTSGAARVLTATVRDAAGNTVTADNTTVVTFGQVSGTGTVTGAGTAIAASGIATKTITAALAGSVSMEATAAGLTTGTLGAFSILPGSAAQLSLAGSTASLTSGTGRVLTATIQDAAGNTVDSDDSTVVTFALSSGTGSVTGTGSATASSGVASKTVTGSLVGPVTIEAAAAGLATDTLGAFTVVPGPAADIVLTGSTATLASGANRLLTATIVDAAGNTVTADNSTVVGFGKASGAGTVTGAGTATASSGVAAKTITGALVGSLTMEATAVGLTTGTLGPFTVVPGAAAKIAVTGSTADLTSGTTRVLTATIQDAAGNTVTADSSTVVSFAKQGGSGAVTGTGSATASSGVSTTTITGALVGPVTIEATATGLTTGTLAAFTVVHGPAAQVALSGSTADLSSGAIRVLTATIQDPAGNTVAADSSTLVSFAQAGTGTVTGTGTATAASGVATKTVTGALAGTVTMEATVAGLTTGTLGAFTVVHGAAAEIALTHSGSVASGDNHTLTATIRDAAGNTVTADSSTLVTFAKTGGVGTVTGLGSATASNGIATTTVVNAALGQIDLEAQAAGLATGTASYVVDAGTASTLTSTVTASPTSIVANGTSTSDITVRLKDAFGNDLSGSGGTVALGLTGTGSLSAVTDNGDGTYSATLTSPTTVGGGTVTGALNAAALAATASVIYIHGPAAQIALAGSGSTVAGDAHALTATIQDANGNTVTSDNSTAVAFAKTGGAGTVSGLDNATAANGVAGIAVTNRLAGQVDVDATASGLAAGASSYTITTGPVSAGPPDSTVGAAPTTVYADGIDTAVITVTLRDAGGNGIAGKTVTLDQGAGSSTISGGGATNASGAVTFSVRDSGVETVTYTATDTTDSITLTDDATVDFTFQDAIPPTNTVTLGSATRAWLSGTTLYYNGAAGGSFTLSSAVADGGSGPASAAYPAVAGPGWAHGAETVTTPAGGPYVSSAFAFAAGSSGDFTYDVTATDAWTPSNSTVTTVNVTEDSTAPSATILCNGAPCPAGWYTGSPVSVALAAPDAGAGLDQIRYTTDGTDPTIVTGTVYAGAFPVAAEGVTTVKYRAFDRIGNDTGVLAQTIRIDTIAPDTTIDSAPAPATQDTVPAFAFSSPDGGTSFQTRVNGGSWTSQTSPFTLGPLADGTYMFEVRSTDGAGNVDGSPASFTFTVDTTPANTTIITSPPAASSSNGASFSFIASDAGPGFECSLDGGVFADCSSPMSYSGLAEAGHTFEVRAEDAAGNVDATPAARAWTVDLTAPDTSFLSTPANPSASQTPTFVLGSNEPPATFECDLDGGGWAPCATPFTTTAPGDGSHTLKARARDAAGNTDSSEVTFTWLLDATAPTGAITAPVNGADVSGTILLASNAADPGGSGVASVLFERSPAGVGAWTGQPASWDTTGQADGDYDVRATTTDNAGNQFTSAVITVTVDNTDPTLSVLAPNPVNLATADPATVSATATDGGTGVAEVRFDQCTDDSTTCASNSWVLLGVDSASPYQASWPIPSDGPRLLRVRATDNAGRQKTNLALVTIDRVRPTGSLTAPSAGSHLRGTSVALAATATDAAPGTVNTVTFQRSPAGSGTWTDVDVDAAAPYAASFDTTVLPDGLYDLRVFTTDTAGNAEAAPATVQVRVDNTAPTGSVSAPAAGASVRGTIGLTGNSADAGSGVATVEFQRSAAGADTWTNEATSFDTTAVADGLYDLRVVTTDAAGNTFTSGAITIRVDNTAPTGSVTSPAPSANVRGTIGLTSNSADAGSGVATVQFQRSPAGAGTWTTQLPSVDTTAVADGLYDLRVVTTDAAGNTFTSGAITIRVDNTLPTGSITAPADGAEIGLAPIALTSNSADAGGSGVATVVFERSPAGAATWTATAATWNTASGLDAVVDGSYDLRVATTDNAGNAFTSPPVTVLVDHTAPTTSASLAPASPSNGAVTVSFSSSDGSGSGVSVIAYRVDGGSLQQGAAAVISAPGDNSNDGSHLVEFFATDEVGNVEALRSVTVVIDTTAPSGTGGDPGDYLRGIANLTYSTAAADVSSVQFQFSPAGAGAWSNIGAADLTPPYDASWNTSLIADGPYDLRAVVTDATGNVADTLLPGLPKTVDNTAPTGSVAAPVAGAYVSGPVAVDASASDGAVPPASGVSAVRFEVKAAGAGAYSVFGTQTAPVVGATYRQTLATTSLADGPADLRVVVTDVAGNEITSTTRTINVDNDAPVVTLADPGAAIGASVALAASSSADTADVTFRYRPVGNLGAGTSIGSDTSTPFGVTWSTSPTAEQQWELIAVATDTGGNVTTSAPRVVLVDRTQPSVVVTAPAAAATVGGPAVALAVNADDSGGSGVALVEWQVQEVGAPSFTTVSSDAAAPYDGTWDSTSAPDGPAAVRARVTDAAGNVRISAAVTVTVDSSGPSVTLVDPGAVVSGSVPLGATTGGGAVRVVFSVSPANAGAWTQIGDDPSPPFSVPFDTTALVDGLYDLRAIGFDGLGNPSTGAVLEDVRVDNTAPQLLSAAPADGSVSASANQIALTASEPVTAPGTTLDGAPAPAPAIAGNQLTFATGALADGLHVLEGELQDASGTRVPFRVAVTIESTPASDPPPVERSITASGDWTLSVPGGLVTVRMPQSAWPTPPTPQDFILILRVDARPVGGGFAPGTQIVDVTARWALAGTSVTEFNAPVEIVFANPSDAPAIPAQSPDGTNWQTIPPLTAPLPASQRDGFSRSGGEVHVFTRHLTYFGLMLDDGPPTPPHDLAGVVAEDGLTIRWVPGTDASGQIGNVTLYVNGESYREFGPAEFEAKLGGFAAGDTRTFTLSQRDAAGNTSPQSASLRALPILAGLTLAEARAALAAASFMVGTVTEVTVPAAVPGTVVQPDGIRLALAETPIDLVVARKTPAPQTRLAFTVAGSRQLPLGKSATVAVRIRLSKPAQMTAILRDAHERRLYTWKLPVRAGATVVKLGLPSRIRKPGRYSLIWIARADTETVSRTLTLRLVTTATAKPKADELEVLLAGPTPAGTALRPGKPGMPRRVRSVANVDRTFDLLAITRRPIGGVVVDADAYGNGFIADLRAVFPAVPVIAISRDPFRRSQSIRAGAVLALPRNASGTELAKAIGRAAAR